MVVSVRRLGSYRPTGAHGWRVWFVGFFLVGVGWSLFTPIEQYPDESDHVFRAVTVVRGHVLPEIGPYTHGTGAVAPVPRGIFDVFIAKPCRSLQGNPQCAERPGDPDTLDVVTSEGRMFPLYYTVVGWPSLISEDRLGVRGMRVVNAALCAALLAGAATILMSIAGRRAVVAAGLFAGLTPLAIYLTGGVNPSGPEAAGAVCFWAAVLALLHGRSSLARPTLLTLAAVSGVTLVTGRFLGMFWVGVILVLSLLSTHRSAWVPFVRGIAKPVLVPIVAFAVVVGLYTLGARSFQTFASLKPVRADFGEIVEASLGNTDRLLSQLVAYFGWLTVPPGPVTLAGWALAVPMIIVFAAYGNWQVRIATGTGLALVFVLPFLFQVASYQRAALGGWQGRYTLPLAVGIPLLTVIPAGVSSLRRRLPVVVAWAAMTVYAVGHLAAIRDAWPTFTTGLGATSRSPAFTAVPLTTACVGLAVLAAGGLLIAAAVLLNDRTRPDLETPPVYNPDRQPVHQNDTGARA
jgi:hypothetical protein